MRSLAISSIMAPTMVLSGLTTKFENIEDGNVKEDDEVSSGLEG